jgi:predicted component of type VI protein secretion system
MTIEDLEKAVAGLPDQYVEFRAWFDAFDADRFDRKIERDAQAGKLDQRANEAQQWHSLANLKNP